MLRPVTPHRPIRPRVPARALAPAIVAPAIVAPALLACALPSLALAQDVSVGSAQGQALLDTLRSAEVLGAELAERLEITRQEFDLPEDIAERAMESLKNGRVRDLLGVPNVEEEAATGADGARYEGGVFLFASFSMPDASLHALLRDASAMKVPVFFHGFVDGSVLATQARVEAIYGGLEGVHGFGIDPTLFERFDVDVVPTLVSTTANLDVCESPDCAEEGTPSHDRMSGNVPLPYALRILAVGNGAHAAPAAAILEAHE